MIRAAERGEEARLEEFLARCPESSMNIRHQLAEYGIGQANHPMAIDFFVMERGAEIVAVFGCAAAGLVVAQAPNAPPEAWAAFAAALEGREVRGVSAGDAYVIPALQALGLEGVPAVFDRREPVLKVDLADVPDGDDELRKPEAGDIPLLGLWFTEYVVATGLVQDPKRASAQAGKLGAEAIGAEQLYLLIEDGQPVAMGAFNGQVGRTVQIGSVFVPKALRNAGRGRRMVGAQLRQARADGMQNAVLLANNAAAERAYLAVGFRQVDTYRAVFFESPHVVDLS